MIYLTIKFKNKEIFMIKNIDALRDFIQIKFQQDTSGHDWHHIDRVTKLALHIAHHENANPFVVELAALLHDIADWKLNNGDTKSGLKLATHLMRENDIDTATINQVIHIVDNVSFKGANVKEKNLCLEGCVVRDADRLDAIGAVGIARVFAYGGHKNQKMYDPQIKPKLHNSFDEYKNKVTTSVNHFHEKLLLLKDRMYTPTGKRLAQERHEFMQMFLDRFYQEHQSN